MYKILINIITKNKDKWIFYQEDGVDYVASSLDDIKDKALELLDEYGEDNVKIVDQRSGDDGKKDIPTYLFGNGTGGTSDYNELENKPKINGVELINNKSLKDLGIIIPLNEDFTLEGLGEKSYNSLDDKPKIPKKVSELENDNKYETVENTDTKIAGAKTYADEAIAHLVGSAPETLDTLEEVAKAIQDNETVVDALNAAIGSKADKTELETKQDTLTAGDNITIENNVISASGGIPTLYLYPDTSTYSMNGFNKVYHQGDAIFDEFKTFYDSKKDLNWVIQVVFTPRFTGDNGNVVCYPTAQPNITKEDYVSKRIAVDWVSDTIYLSSSLHNNGIAFTVVVNARLDNNKNIQDVSIYTKSLPYLPMTTTDNSTVMNYTPTEDYNPATKKYVDVNKYTLPIASADTLGGIKIGDGLSVDEDGVITTADLPILNIYSTRNNSSPSFEYYDNTSYPVYNSVLEFLQKKKYQYFNIREWFTSYNPSSGVNPYHVDYICQWGGNKDIYSEGQHRLDLHTIPFQISNDIGTTSMDIQYTVSNGSITLDYVRLNRLVSNFKEYTLTKTNTTEYTPTSNYHPATKKYVDDNIALVSEREELDKELKILTIPDSMSGVITLGGSRYVKGQDTEWIKTTNKILNEIYQNQSNKKYTIIIKDKDGLFGIGQFSSIPSYNSTGEKQFRITLPIITMLGSSNSIKDSVRCAFEFDVAFYTNITNNTVNIDISNLTTSYNVYYCPQTFATGVGNGYKSIYFTHGAPLGIGNTLEYTPTSNYNPATKKYVDDQIGSINTVLATLTTVTEESDT